MAGSYRHCTDSNNKLISNEDFPKYIENLGDAYEAIEEMYQMIQILTDGDKDLIRKTHIEYIKRCGGNVEYAESSNFWF